MAPFILPHVGPKSDLSSVISFDISKDGRIASVASDGFLRIWENNQLHASWMMPEVISVLWNPDGTVLLGVSIDTIFLWKGEEFQRLTHIKDIKSVQ